MSSLVTGNQVYHLQILPKSRGKLASCNKSLPGIQRVAFLNCFIGAWGSGKVQHCPRNHSAASPL